MIVEDWATFHGLCFSDPEWGKPSHIERILDTEVYACTIRQGLIQGPPGDRIMAINTALGWMAVGGKEDRPESATSHIDASHLATDDLDAALQRFGKVETVPQITHLTQEEEDCYNHFKATHTCNADGRFVLHLPFKDPAHPGMKGIAEACLIRLERRFDRQPEVAKLNRNLMPEYFQLNHVAKVPDDQVTMLFSSYIPYHPVFKRDNPKKNSLLHVGPKLQDEVLDNIICWSFFPIVFSCDIFKMFRQFLIAEEDWDWQRILWRFSADEIVGICRLVTVTYGTAAAC